jgi:hypothetical protein
MDPTACLIACDQAITDGDLDVARDRVGDYYLWRRRGGFEPVDVAGTAMRGDEYARQCQRRIDAALNRR